MQPWWSWETFKSMFKTLADPSSVYIQCSCLVNADALVLSGYREQATPQQLWLLSSKPNLECAPFSCAVWSTRMRALRPPHVSWEIQGLITCRFSAQLLLLPVRYCIKGTWLLRDSRRAWTFCEYLKKNCLCRTHPIPVREKTILIILYSVVLMYYADQYTLWTNSSL